VNCVLPDQESVQWGALVSTVMNIRISWKAGHFLPRWVTVRFSRRTSLLLFMIS
jgi:hypothetical protein